MEGRRNSQAANHLTSWPAVAGCLPKLAGGRARWDPQAGRQPSGRKLAAHAWRLASRWMQHWPACRLAINCRESSLSESVDRSKLITKIRLAGGARQPTIHMLEELRRSVKHIMEWQNNLWVFRDYHGATQYFDHQTNIKINRFECYRWAA